jgi:hypothetical protein
MPLAVKLPVVMLRQSCCYGIVGKNLNQSVFAPIKKIKKEMA